MLSCIDTAEHVRAPAGSVGNSKGVCHAPGGHGGRGATSGLILHNHTIQILGNTSRVGTRAGNGEGGKVQAKLWEINVDVLSIYIKTVFTGKYKSTPHCEIP